MSDHNAESTTHYNDSLVDAWSAVVIVAIAVAAVVFWVANQG
jgi:hypothetical protein